MCYLGESPALESRHIGKQDPHEIESILAISTLLRAAPSQSVDAVLRKADTKMRPNASYVGDVGVE